MAQANITRYLHWLRKEKGLDFASYQQLWQWSVTELEGFWGSLWEYFKVKAHRPYEKVLAERRMPGALWFNHAELNYAEHALGRRDNHPAILCGGENRRLTTLTFAELYRQTAAAAAGLRGVGVQKGDRVAALLPNLPQTVTAFLASASMGAVWSSCSPDFGISSIVERFRQIEPKVLLVVDEYHYKGKTYPCLEAVEEIQRDLPSLKATVVVSNGENSPGLNRLPGAMLWDQFLFEETELVFEAVPFDHPLWVLYSSGTTGPPKPIVQGHGGILLEHFKELSFHLDLSPQDRFFWFTTTGWMMWNLLVGGLLLGTTVVLYDGSPAYPDLGSLWHFAEETGMTYFGTSASYIQSCMKSGLDPGGQFNLDSLTSLGSTGSPLSPEGFAWVYEKVKKDLLLGSLSGGTDLCTGFLGPCPLLPVYAGEIQCPQLGARVAAYDPGGRAVVNEVGELVITEPMPSMPIFFWNDSGDRRYRESYFKLFPGVWRHGDWIKINPRGGCVIYGRSDSTLNRGGVRMGTSEFYRVVEKLPEVLDSLVLDSGHGGEEGRLLLFVVLPDGVALTEELKSRINQAVSRELSPRHIPDQIHTLEEVPRTLNGKKLEVPLKRILSGISMEEAVSEDAVVNPQALQLFVDLANRLRPSA